MVTDNVERGWPWPVPADVFPDPDRLDTIENINKAINSLAKAIALYSLSPKPRYVLDGQEFDWPTLLGKMHEAMTALVKLRQMIGGQVKVGWLGTFRRRRFIGSP